ncbi:MAG: hypothetical protein MJE77_05910 [Proteobacteria bacterium]|nr:hypothetical protein [Pseudomonadota bacterium]
MEACAQAVGWSIAKIEIKNLEDDLLSPEAPWPSETIGAATYSKGEGTDTYNLFWSTYTQDDLTKITGGLYIKQYLVSDASFLRACNSAFDDICILFGGNEVLCVVLALEDDEAIDLGPGIAGSYRSSLWQRMSPAPLDGLVQRTTRAGWVNVRPLHEDDEGPVSVFSMGEDTRSSILEIQETLTALL